MPLPKRAWVWTLGVVLAGAPTVAADDMPRSTITKEAVQRFQASVRARMSGSDLTPDKAEDEWTSSEALRKDMAGTVWRFAGAGAVEGFCCVNLGAPEANHMKRVLDLVVKSTYVNQSCAVPVGIDVILRCVHQQYSSWTRCQGRLFDLDGTCPRCFFWLHASETFLEAKQKEAGES
eukprot:s215_g25.t1